MNILIVEDEMLLALDLEMSLTDMGHTILGSFRNGEDALSFIEKNRPDVVLLDIKLEGELDGIEASKVIHYEYNVPVIFVTGNTDSNTLTKAQEMNPVGIINKPIKDYELSEFLQQVVV
jgi:DNA-binding NtrC family response regulator